MNVEDSYARDRPKANFSCPMDPDAVEFRVTLSFICESDVDHRGIDYKGSGLCANDTMNVKLSVNDRKTRLEKVKFRIANDALGLVTTWVAWDGAKSREQHPDARSSKEGSYRFSKICVPRLSLSSSPSNWNTRIVKMKNRPSTVKDNGISCGFWKVGKTPTSNSFFPMETQS